MKEERRQLYDVYPQMNSDFEKKEAGLEELWKKDRLVQEQSRRESFFAENQQK